MVILKDILPVHGGAKFSCDKCDYKATQYGSILTHKLSKHDCVKFECDLCPHKSSHKAIMNEGLKYPC